MSSQNLEFEIHIGKALNKARLNFVASPELIYEIVHSAILHILAGENNPDATQQQRALVQLTKTTIKGALLMLGDKILTMMFGSKDHPRPNKQDDLIEWYSDIFAKMLISEAMKGTAILTVKEGNLFEDGPFIIDEIRTFGLATIHPGEQAEGEAISQQDTSTVSSA
jgi:hypothetical protein